MRLLDRSLLHLAVALLLVLAVWASAFFLVMRDAVQDSIDEGLDDQEEMILYRVKSDSTLLHVHDLGLYGFAITQVEGKVKQRFSDTLLYVPSEGEVEAVRLLTKGFKHQGVRYQLQIYSSTVEEEDLLETLLIALVVLYVVLLLTIMLVQRFVLRRTWQPFHAILNRLKTFRLGTPTQVSEVATGVYEFRELKAAADVLMRHASEAYAQQRAFTENAAHELQTPLAIAINKLELLAEQQAGEEERMEVVSEVIALLERLTRLNRSLLLLARIENRQFLDERPVHFGQLATQVLDEFADLATHREVELSIEVHAALQRMMDPALARTLITNLVKNAIVHNMRGGRATVQVYADRVVVSNTGQDRALDTERIFDRFYKQTTTDAGTGLGLAIAKAIAELYGLQLHYAFHDTHRITVQVK